MRLLKNEEVLVDKKVNEIEKYIDDNMAIIEDFFVNLNKLKTETNQQLSRADKKRTDMEHFIEFNDLNAAEGYKAYKILQRILQERRIVKDNAIKINVILESNIDWFSKGNYTKEIDKLERRTYTPRILKCI